MNRWFALPRCCLVWLLATMVVTLIACGSGEEAEAPATDQGQESNGEPIKIGVAGPMEFVIGEHHWKGAEMARDEINEAGGVQIGDTFHPIELVKIDTNETLNVTDAVTALERAITVDGVDYLVGGFRSEAVLAMQEVAVENEKIFIVAGAGHPGITERVGEDYDKFKYTFRVTPINSNYMGQVSFLLLAEAARVMAEELGLEDIKVALLIEQAAWADPVVEAAQQVIPSMGMEVTGVFRPSPVATDVTSELTGIENSGAHIIFTILSSPVGVTFAQQWGELEIPAAVVGINAEAQNEEFWEATHGYAEYIMKLNTYAPEVHITDQTVDFYQRFRERYGMGPLYSAGTYDAIYILKEAIERAGTLENDAVIAELEETDYTGAAGRVVFDENHDVTWGPGYVTSLGTQWVDGKVVGVWPNGWEGVTYDGIETYRIPPWVREHWGN
ncbi:ABC transporter substrate-binding protein [Caldalkalibacillus thermarum TA2.A1]|uniref:ABC transporter substrate-binding protein n=1 Tax=Caldalkalibacillus thermarum (strain TA2.A1) TaxID=986075 RepID=A0A8X8I8N3_CALTT|nr:ABC transporter substrate-binding protein [Caldalkalibacillus thermarum]QZT33589.1 ABC transporter substrate-binding protein [Caldalkalibacillus thermarum TA2.A1]